MLGLGVGARHWLPLLKGALGPSLGFGDVFGDQRDGRVRFVGAALVSGAVVSRADCAVVETRPRESATLHVDPCTVDRNGKLPLPERRALP